MHDVSETTYFVFEVLVAYVFVFARVVSLP